MALSYGHVIFTASCLTLLCSMGCCTGQQAPSSIYPLQGEFEAVAGSQFSIEFAVRGDIDLSPFKVEEFDTSLQGGDNCQDSRWAPSLQQLNDGDFNNVCYSRARSEKLQNLLCNPTFNLCETYTPYQGSICHFSPYTMPSSEHPGRVFFTYDKDRNVFTLTFICIHPSDDGDYQIWLDDQACVRGLTSGDSDFDGCTPDATPPSSFTIKVQDQPSYRLLSQSPFPSHAVSGYAMEKPLKFKREQISASSAQPSIPIFVIPYIDSLTNKSLQFDVGALNFFTAAGVQWSKVQRGNTENTQMMPNFAIDAPQGKYGIGFIDFGTCAVYDKPYTIQVDSPFIAIRTNVILNFVVFGGLVIILVAITKVSVSRVRKMAGTYVDSEDMNPFRRILLVLKMKDDEFADVAGMDAMMFIVFIRFCLIFAIIFSFAAIVGALPIYLSKGKAYEKSDQMMRSTVYNLGDLGLTQHANEKITSEMRLINVPAAFSLCILTTMIVMGLVVERRMLRWSVKRNIRDQSTSFRSVYMQGIPKRIKSNVEFTQYLVEKIGTSEAENIVESHLVYFQDLIVKKQEKRIRAIKRLETLGVSDVLGATAGSARRVKNAAKIAQTKSKLEELNKQMAALQQAKSFPTGTGFITFKSTRAAMEFMRNHSREPPRGLVGNDSIFGKLVFSGHKNAPVNSLVCQTCQFAPEPHDIQWQFVGASKGSVRFRLFLSWLLSAAVLAITFGFLLVVVGLQVIIEHNLLPYVFRDGGAVSSGPFKTFISFSCSSVIIIMARILPVIFNGFGKWEGQMTRSKCMVNVFQKVLLVQLVILVVSPALAIDLIRRLLTLACGYRFDFAARTIFSIRTMLQFALMSIALDYLLIGARISRVLQIRNDAQKAGRVIPGWVETILQVLVTEDRCTDFDQLFHYSIVSVVFVFLFGVGLYIPVVAPLGTVFLALKYVLCKVQLVYVYKQTPRSDGKLLRQVFSSLLSTSAAAVMFANFFLGVSLKFETFTLITIIGGIFVFVAAISMSLPLPRCFPTSSNRVKAEAIAASLFDMLDNTDSTTRYENDFGAYASPYLSQHLAMYSVALDDYEIDDGIQDQNSKAESIEQVA